MGLCRRRDCMRRQTGTSHIGRYSGLCYRHQGAQRGRPQSRHRPHHQTCQETGWSVDTIRRQRGHPTQQQTGDARDTHRWRRQCRFEDEGLGQDCEFGTQGNELLT